MAADWQAWALSVSILTAWAGSPRAQIALPARPLALPSVGSLLQPVEQTAADAAKGARDLASARLERLDALVRSSGHALEMTRDGPAVRDEIIAVDPDPQATAAAGALGLRPIGNEAITELGLRTVTFAAPAGADLDALVRRLRHRSPSSLFTANHIYIQSGPTARAPGPRSDCARWRSGPRRAAGRSIWRTPTATSTRAAPATKGGRAP